MDDPSTGCRGKGVRMDESPYGLPEYWLPWKGEFIWMTRVLITMEKGVRMDDPSTGCRGKGVHMDESPYGLPEYWLPWKGEFVWMTRVLIIMEKGVRMDDPSSGVLTGKGPQTNRVMVALVAIHGKGVLSIKSPLDGSSMATKREPV